MLYLIAIILVIGWLLGFFFTNIGNLLYILLVLAAISVLLRIIRGR